MRADTGPFWATFLVYAPECSHVLEPWLTAHSQISVERVRTSYGTGARQATANSHVWVFSCHTDNVAELDDDEGGGVLTDDDMLRQLRQVTADAKQAAAEVQRASSQLHSAHDQ